MESGPEKIRCRWTARPRGGLVTSSGTGSPEGSRCRCSLGTLGECLKPVGNDLDGTSSAAIGGLPLAALQPTLDVEEASLAEVAGDEVSELGEKTTRGIRRESCRWLQPGRS